MARIIILQLDKALEEFLSDSYNEDEQVELLKLLALIANINNELIISEANNNQLLNDIRNDVFKFSRDKEVQLMILAEEMAAMDWYSGINQARREAHAEAHAEALEALVNSLRPFISDSDTMLSAIKANKGFENTTLDMVEKYW